VEKVSLEMANSQGLVGPKLSWEAMQIAKGNQVNIPELLNLWISKLQS